MKIVFFGLSITSSWGNGHATTYRALIKALAARGHQVVFIEKDVEWYRGHRDLPTPDFCMLKLYADWQLEHAALLALTADADAVVMGSYFPDATEASQALFAAARCPVLFFDIDTPITVAALRTGGAAAYLLAADIPHYAAYLSFSSGPMLGELEQRFGARRAVAFLCSVDPELYQPAASVERYRADLSYLGTYAADRQPKLAELLLRPAGMMPERRFLVAGPQYPADADWGANVSHLDHVPPAEHPAFYSSAGFTLNLTRADMIAAGYSPSVRLFEASACGAAILSDNWPGLREFLTPGEEILIVSAAEDVCRLLRDTTPEDRQAMGRRARERILAAHTSAHRAAEFEAVVAASSASHSRV